MVFTAVRRHPRAPYILFGQSPQHRGWDLDRGIHRPDTIAWADIDRIAGRDGSAGQSSSCRHHHLDHEPDYDGAVFLLGIRSRNFDPRFTHRGF